MQAELCSHLGNVGHTSCPVSFVGKQVSEHPRGLDGGEGEVLTVYRQEFWGSEAILEDNWPPNLDR